MDNSSYITVFTLSGLNASRGIQYAYFSLSLTGYILILFLNLTLIFIILLEKSLHEPMYIFLCNLCFNSLYGASGFYPKFLSDILSDSHTISYQACYLQVFVIYTSVKCEFSTLTVMAYDRYEAICRPLQYHSVMTTWPVVKLIAFTWFFSFVSMSLSIILSSRLSLCGSHIDKLYCENWSIVKLSCVPTNVNNINGFILIAIYFVHCVFIFFTYVKLVSVCTKSKENQKKFAQTCLPHLLALINFMITMLFDTMYTRYGSIHIPQNLRNFLAIQFLVIPPFLNPLIYGLKLTKIRRKLFSSFSASNPRHVA